MFAKTEDLRKQDEPYLDYEFNLFQSNDSIKSI